MNKSVKSWDNLSGHFDTYGSDVNPGVAANIRETYLVLETYINRIGKNSKVLDFGCGTGGLCHKLFSKKLQTYGYDISSKMIDVAKSNSAKEIQFFTGNNSKIKSFAPYDLITSLMVLQFIENLDEVIELLAESLNSNGILWFAVHNENYVFSKNKGHTKFINYIKENNKKEASIVLFGEEIKLYVRSANEYSKIISSHGLTEDLRWYSKKYSDGTPAKYLVMGFRKN